jgi:heme exporter protein C
MSRRALLAKWLLWLWLAAVFVAAFHWAPLAADFLGQSSRILFFHVPMAWVSFVAFMTSGVWSLRYLAGSRAPASDRAAAAAIEIGLVFACLATLTGAIWARIMWNSWWNWDPRETSIVVAILYYAAYLALRASLPERESRARLAAVYATLGLVVAPFFYFVLPRLGFSLHPEAVINAQGKIEVEPRMLAVLIASSAGFTALFFWILRLRTRLGAAEERLVEEVP